ncbi:MAG: hypothetical protein ACFFG0_13660 [Candidatus Thorarchaeota archaeon]
MTTSLYCNDLVRAVILHTGSPEQPRQFLIPICEKLTFILLHVSEPEIGSNVADIRTIAKK